MNLIIAPTDAQCPELLLRGVSTYLVDTDTLHVLYSDGRRQNYPLRNVRWYGEETPTPIAQEQLRCGGFKAPIVGCFCPVCESAREDYSGQD